jgi:hypothetical protein
VPQPLKNIGVAVEGRGAEQVAEVGVGGDMVLAHQRRRAVEHRSITGIATDGGKERELLQRLSKGSRRRSGVVGENPG